MFVISASRLVLPSFAVVVFLSSAVVEVVFSMVFIVFPLSGRCAMCVMQFAGLRVLIGHPSSGRELV